MLKRAIAVSAVSLALLAGPVPLARDVLAQQAGAANAALNQLPPALRAAVLSGNSAAITQAINVLAAGNPTQAATLANGVVNAAEQILATNPQAAVTAAAAAVSVVNALPVQTSAPQQVSATVTTAARIFIAPSAISVAPQIVAQGAVAITQIVSSPAVYAANPQAAINAMASAYQAVTNPIVASSAPAATQSVVNNLNTASANNQLNSANPTNNSQIAQILAQPRPDPGGQNPGAGNTVQQPAETPVRPDPPSNPSSPT